MTPIPDPKDVERYQNEGVILLRGMFKDWVEVLRNGFERNLKQPGPFAIENTRPGEEGRFFEDYCNWERIPEYKEFITQSGAARMAAALMKSSRAQFFHEHILVKEAGTQRPTPWHQDMPYYCVEGMQTVSFWVPLDPVPRKNSLRLVAGSHLWEKMIRPTRWKDGSDFYPVRKPIRSGRSSDVDPHSPDAELSNGVNRNVGDFMEIPGIRDDQIRVWDVEPGDAIAFNFYILHGTTGDVQENRRRAFSHRWVGDDVRFVDREERTSPPFPGINQKTGERLRGDWFPIMWRAE